MIVYNNGALYLARSSVQWAEKQGLPHGVKWNRTVWGAESQIDMVEWKVNTHKIAMFIFEWLFMFVVPRLVTKIGGPKKKKIVGIEEKNRKIQDVAWGFFSD